MDLLQSVRKEGSRGGRANFSWDDIKTNAHRENYLGHSVMAPVGRWQKNKDLSWYARGAGGEDGSHVSAEEERKAEIRRVKEAEEDALARALGYEVPEREKGGNANLTALGPARDVGRKVKESVDEGLDEDAAGAGATSRGLGYGGFSGGMEGAAGDSDEVLEGTKMPAQRHAVDSRRRDGRDRHGRDGDERRRRRRDDERGSHRRRARSRSRTRSRSRSKQRDSDRHYKERARRRSRSRSYERRDDLGTHKHYGREERRRPEEDGRERNDRDGHRSWHRDRSKSPEKRRRHERSDRGRYD